MSSWFKSKKQCRFVAVLTTALMAAVSLVFLWSGAVWHTYDYKALDLFYRKAVAGGLGPPASFTPRIIYMTVTDSSYDFFGKHFLDRQDLAGVNQDLEGLGAAAVAYDIIFARPGLPDSDTAFAQSIRRLGSVYLPVGCELAEEPAAFDWDSVEDSENLFTGWLSAPVESGEGRPYHAVRSLMQQRRFMEVARGSGDISVKADPDSVYRHLPLLVKVGDRYLPALSLSLFLDWAGVNLEEVVVNWGDSLTIPAGGSARLRKDVVIPIDDHGRSFIPFVNRMGRDFPVIPVHRFLRLRADESLRGNLLDAIEGNFVLVGDVSVGVSDLGATTLEESAPLLTLHAAMLNGMLTGTFYRKWSFPQVLLLVVAAGILLGAAAALKSSRFLYGAGMSIVAGLAGLTWTELIHFRLFPVITAGAAILAILFGVVVVLEFMASRERSFIRNTFSRYVPSGVVNELLAHPGMIRLGGEERLATVLFSDLANFTTISEKMSPPGLVELLNEYLTEMTAIIMEYGGIIDKFQGDAIMAEFGVPVPQPDHADRAVKAALAMQRRLTELQDAWRQKGLPALVCRIGINTGSMVVGNMGSRDVLDYTVIGDAVNLASRLEAANKRYNTFLMISRFTSDYLTPGLFRMRVLDVIRVKGKDEAIKVYEVYGRCDEPVDPRREKYCRIYSEAFEAYLARNFASAYEGFGRALALLPDDPAALDMRRRIKDLEGSSLPGDWDGSIRLTSK